MNDKKYTRDEAQKQCALDIEDAIMNNAQGGVHIWHGGAGIGKTRAAYAAIDKAMLERMNDNFVIVLPSHEQLDDAMRYKFKYLKMFDPLIEADKGKVTKLSVETAGALSEQAIGLRYRGRYYVDKKTGARMCLNVENNEDETAYGLCKNCTGNCPYNWQKLFMTLVKPRVVAGAHAMLKIDATFQEFMPHISGVIVDEDYPAFEHTLTLSRQGIMRIALLCQWEVGIDGYNDWISKLYTLAATLPIERPLNSASMRNFDTYWQTDVIRSALLAFETHGVTDAFSQALAEIYIAIEHIIEYGRKESPGDEGYNEWIEYRAWRSENYDDKQTPLSVNGVSMQRARNELGDLLTMLRYMLGRDTCFTVRTELNGSVTLRRALSHLPFPFFTGRPIAWHFINATPELLLEKFRSRNIAVNVHSYPLDNHNVEITHYCDDSYHNSLTKSAAPMLANAIREMKKRIKGRVLVVLPRSEDVDLYRESFNATRVHFAYPQVLAGRNDLSDCDGVIIYGNYQPGETGIQDQHTVMYGAMPMVRRDIEYRPTIESQGEASLLLVQYPTLYGRQTWEVAFMMIGAQLWQAICRTRPLDKPQPVPVWLISNFHLEGYLQRYGHASGTTFKYGKLPLSITGAKLPAKIRNMADAVLALVPTFGGVILEPSWLKARWKTRRQRLFTSAGCAEFIKWCLWPSDHRDKLFYRDHEWTLTTGHVGKMPITCLVADAEKFNMTFAAWAKAQADGAELHNLAEEIGDTPVYAYLQRRIRNSKDPERLIKSRVWQDVMRSPLYDSEKNSEIRADFDRAWATLR